MVDLDKEIVAKKSLGQHWLNDPASLEAMSADVAPADVVLEIGPGLGSLTRRLLGKASKVVAIEKDEALAARLLTEFKNERLEVVIGDILQFDLTSLPAGYKVVANIPYYLTSNLIRVLSESSNPPSAVTLLIQREVAERLAAAPGQMSVLAVTAQFYWQVSLGRVVEAELFDPPPKVDSQIVSLTRRQKPPFEVNDKDFFRLVKAGFSQKRKTLLNSLSAGLAISRPEVSNLLQVSNVNPSARAQTLSLDDWHQLYQSLNR